MHVLSDELNEVIMVSILYRLPKLYLVPIKLMKAPTMAAEKSYELEIRPDLELGSLNLRSTVWVLTLFTPFTTKPEIQPYIHVLFATFLFSCVC